MKLTSAMMNMFMGMPMCMRMSFVAPASETPSPEQPG